MIHRFRQEVYQSFEQRGDAGLDLIDALSSARANNGPKPPELPPIPSRFSWEGAIPQGFVYFIDKVQI